MRRTVTICIALLVVFICFPATSVYGNPLWPGFFELLDRVYSLTIPPDGSEWEALVSTEGSTWDHTLVQSSYDDDGDGVVSAGDWIWGQGSSLARDAISVIYAGPLYRLVENDWVLTPVATSGGSPVCETWEVLLPTGMHGDTFHVDDWSGPGGEPQEGDQINLNGTWYTIAGITLVVQGDFGTPVEATTWGRIKTWLSRIF